MILEYQYRRKQHGQARADTGDGQLQAHGQCHVLAFEPFGNGTGDRHAGNFTAQSEQRAADIGDGQRSAGRQAGRRDGPGDDGRTDHHQSYEHGTDDPYAELVEQDAADDQAAPYTEERIAAGIEAELLGVPAELQHLRILEDLRHGREHIVEEIGAEHRHHQAGQRQPTGDPA